MISLTGQAGDPQAGLLLPPPGDRVHDGAQRPAVVEQRGGAGPRVDAGQHDSRGLEVLRTVHVEGVALAGEQHVVVAEGVGAAGRQHRGAGSRRRQGLLDPVVPAPDAREVRDALRRAACRRASARR